MKTLTKKIGTFVLGLTALLSATSCTQTSENARISFDSYSASSTYSMIGSASDFNRPTDVICCDSVSLVLPLTLDKTDVNRVRDLILEEAFGQKAMSVEKAMHTWLDNAAKEHSYKTVMVPYSEISNAVGINVVRGFVVYLSPKVMVYCVNHNTMMPGAANGLSTRKYVNYLLEDGGKILTLQDIFTPEGLAELPSLIASQAEKYIEYAGNVSITETPRDDSFYLSSEDEIVFHYDPMEVGPHSLGDVEIAFYPAELVHQMTPAAIKLFGLEDILRDF